MNEILFELGKLTQGQKDIEKAVHDGVEDMKDALFAHAVEDRDTFKEHAGRLTKLEHANVRISLIAALVAFGFSVVVPAIVRAFFG